MKNKLNFIDYLLADSVFLIYFTDQSTYKFSKFSRNDLLVSQNTSYLFYLIIVAYKKRPN